MNISITLNAEQSKALNDLVLDFNKNKETPLSSEEYLGEVLLGIINDKAKRNFKDVSDSLVRATEPMSYEDRLDLISLVESKLK